MPLNEAGIYVARARSNRHITIYPPANKSRVT